MKAIEMKNFHFYRFGNRTISEETTPDGVICSNGNTYVGNETYIN